MHAYLRELQLYYLCTHTECTTYVHTYVRAHTHVHVRTGGCITLLTRSLISWDVAVTARFPFPLVHFILAFSFKGGKGILQHKSHAALLLHACTAQNSVSSINILLKRISLLSFPGTLIKYKMH